MPRNSKRKVIQRRHSCSAYSDITLEDFANSGKSFPGIIRLKKGTIYAAHNEARKLRGCGANSVAMSLPENRTIEQDDDIHWFDKDINDFDFDPKDSESSEVVEEQVNSKKENRRHHKKKLQKTSDNSSGFVYPIDLWFLLSQYIHPESVGIFARICRMTYSVTHTVQFWRQLYFRYCTELSKLPDHLQPESLERIHGIRQRVIRALFHLYPSLAERTNSNLPFEDEHHSLVGLRCIVMWYEPVKNLWNFNFKLRKERICDINKLVTIKNSQRDKDLYNGYCDVYSNADNDCYLLQVTCQNFQNVTSVMGMVLSNTTLKVSQGMRYHCLRLHFDSCMKTTTNHVKNKSGDIVVTLDPVINLKVFPWWHPKYPEM